GTHLVDRRRRAVARRPGRRPRPHRPRTDGARPLVRGGRRPWPAAAGAGRNRLDPQLPGRGLRPGAGRRRGRLGLAATMAAGRRARHPRRGDVRDQPDSDRPQAVPAADSDRPSPAPRGGCGGRV
ncbi:MAG: hypothetical protein AVDCRST_MAG59-2901, partial [uncultured Thermomicrobiales bacterium]